MWCNSERCWHGVALYIIESYADLAMSNNLSSICRLGVARKMVSALLNAAKICQSSDIPQVQQHFILNTTVMQSTSGICHWLDKRSRLLAAGTWGRQQVRAVMLVCPLPRKLLNLLLHLQPLPFNNILYHQSKAVIQLMWSILSMLIKLRINRSPKSWKNWLNSTIYQKKSKCNSLLIYDWLIRFQIMKSAFNVSKLVFKLFQLLVSLFEIEDSY